MRQTARTTRSATHLQRRSKRIEILSKIEEGINVTASPAQDKANTASSLEPIVKVEETDAKLRCKLLGFNKHRSEKRAEPGHKITQLTKYNRWPSKAS